MTAARIIPPYAIQPTRLAIPMAPTQNGTNPAHKANFRFITILLALGNRAHNRKTLVPPAVGVLGSEARPRHGSYHPRQFNPLVLLFRWLRRKMVPTHFVTFGCVPTSSGCATIVSTRTPTRSFRHSKSVSGEPRQSYSRLCKASRHYSLTQPSCKAPTHTHSRRSQTSTSRRGSAYLLSPTPPLVPSKRHGQICRWSGSPRRATTLFSIKQSTTL
ncbi:hypothetical protein K438DRAFT_1805674 [Mycena galopus ATCC 62051]|nr:hypothetical protein K438DRAFT_1805674 [Mycena galopus ATCC 62051]